MGFWDVQGGPTVAITVQVLDAIAIGQGDVHLTFSLSSSKTVTRPDAQSREFEEPTYNYEGMQWFRREIPDRVSISLDDAKVEAKPKLGLLVATETELRQVLRLMRPLPKKRRLWRVTHGHETTYIGRFGSHQAVVVLCSMGTQGPTGATLTANSVITTWNLAAAVFVGIAFGANRSKQLPADVLVASQLIPYESQRRGSQTIYRNPIPPTGGRLLNRFRNALDWNFLRPDGSKCAIIYGPVLSGDKLVDNPDFKRELLDAYPNAVGGEMEGAGLWAAADRTQTEWIVVKAVCDWGDGRKHDDYQVMAAAAAASLCFHIFDDPNALDGF